jgi:Fe-S-cluster containining protein
MRNRFEIGCRMFAQDAIDFVKNEITEVGALMHSLSSRYEGIFKSLRASFVVELERADSVAAAAHAATAIADAAATSFREQMPNQPVIACSASCAACCHLHVKVAPGVATIISDYISANFSVEDRAALQVRLENAATASRNAADATKLRQRCPLLGAGDRCSVYPVRPLSCRAFTSGSVSRCHEVVFGQNTGDGGVVQSPAHFRIYMEATAALEIAARNRGLPDQQIELSAALLDKMGASDQA